MLRRLLAGAMLAALLIPGPVLARRATPPPTPTTQAGPLAEFSAEAAAQAHCPQDMVVWLNTKTGAFHEKGMRWYGSTKASAFVCRREADGTGDRDRQNSQ